MKSEFIESDLDKIQQQTSKSFEKKDKKDISWIKKIYLTLCPCLFKKNVLQKNSSPPLPYLSKQYPQDKSEQTQSNMDPMKLQILMNTRDYKTIQLEKQPEFTISHLHSSTIERKIQKIQDRYLKKMGQSLKIKQEELPINQMISNKLIIYGNDKGKMICFLQNTQLFPSSKALKIQKRQQNSKKNIQIYYSKHLDQFWPFRYQYFQRFDEGIKIDEQSLFNLIPEAITEYIASQVKCQVILDAFSGIGSQSIKFSKTCSRVISIDKCAAKLQCLLINSKIYSAQNIQIVQKCFLDYNGIMPDVIFLHPKVKQKSIRKTQEKHILQMEDFEPNLLEVLNKSLVICNNFILLLPININIQRIISEISKIIRKTQSKTNTCVIKIQKIKYSNKLHSLIIYYGPLVQKTIKLSEELSEIYKLFNGDDIIKDHYKRVIRTIREQYGMVNLLNYIYQSRKQQRNNKTEINSFGVFQLFLVQNQLITKKHLEKLKSAEKKNQEKGKHQILPGLQEQKLQRMQNQIERTNSYYSNLTLSEEPNSQTKQNLKSSGQSNNNKQKQRFTQNLSSNIEKLVKINQLN